MTGTAWRICGGDGHGFGAGNPAAAESEFSLVRPLSGTRFGLSSIRLPGTRWKPIGTWPLSATVASTDRQAGVVGVAGQRVAIATVCRRSLGAADGGIAAMLKTMSNTEVYR